MNIIVSLLRSMVNIDCLLLMKSPSKVYRVASFSSEKPVAILIIHRKLDSYFLTFNQMIYVLTTSRQHVAHLNFILHYHEDDFHMPSSYLAIWKSHWFLLRFLHYLLPLIQSQLPATSDFHGKKPNVISCMLFLEMAVT